MLTLYGTKGSGSAAIEAALARAGMAYTGVDAASWNPGPGRDELLRVNPLGQIPTLVLKDGTVLTESAAILIHLGLTAPPGLLLPTDAGARARVLRGLVYIAANCYAAISVIDYPERWCEPCDDTMKAQIRAGTREGMTGVWVEDRKLASIGVGVRQWITLHGFGINLTKESLRGFQAITPCGLDGVAMTCLSAESPLPVTRVAFTRALLPALALNLDKERVPAEP